MNSPLTQTLIFNSTSPSVTSNKDIKIHCYKREGGVGMTPQSSYLTEHRFIRAICVLFHGTRH